MVPYNKKLIGSSRHLRKNMTDAERKLWSKLRLQQINGLHFYRQKIIGDYIVDFYCHQKKLVIEVDGSQNFKLNGLVNDKKRDSYLHNLGINVLRFNDVDVLTSTEGVFESILASLGMMDEG